MAAWGPTGDEVVAPGSQLCLRPSDLQQAAIGAGEDHAMFSFNITQGNAGPVPTAPSQDCSAVRAPINQ